MDVDFPVADILGSLVRGQLSRGKRVPIGKMNEFERDKILLAVLPVSSSFRESMIGTT